jgi:hypothetical protein
LLVLLNKGNEAYKLWKSEQPADEPAKGEETLEDMLEAEEKGTK